MTNIRSHGWKYVVFGAVPGTPRLKIKKWNTGPYFCASTSVRSKSGACSRLQMTESLEDSVPLDGKEFSQAERC